MKRKEGDNRKRDKVKREGKLRTSKQRDEETKREGIKIRR